MKKALSLILTAVMLLSIFTCVPVVAQALDLEGTCGDSVTYTFDVSTGLLTLGGSGETGSYYKDSPFYNHSEIKKVVVGSGVTKLGTMLFRKCAGLKTVELSGAENLVSIGDSAFEECTSLTRIINPLSHNFKYIYSGAFFSCTSLKSYRLPNDLEMIDDNTFNDCRVLESITIPATVTKIENYAFHRCYELKDIYFEGTYSEWSSITIEGDHIGLEDVEVHYQSTCDYIGDNAMYILDSFRGKITITGTGATYDYNGTDNVSPFANSDVYSLDVEDGITTLGTNLFSGCDGLEEIVLPGTLTGIKANAFLNCNGIASILYNNGTSKMLKSITDPTGNSALLNAVVSTYGKCGDNLIYMFDESSGMIMIGANGKEDFSMYDYTSDTMPWKEFKGDIVSVLITDYVTSIGANAFNGCKNLAELTIAETVESIGVNAFAGCTGLKTVNYSGDDSAWDAVSIASGNEPLLSLKPQTITEGACGEDVNYYFKFSTGILAISGTGDMNDYTSSTVPWKDYRDNITSVIVEDGVTSIGNSAFEYCDNLTTVTLGNDVAYIGNYAFNSCDNLSSINLPDSVTNLGLQVFSETALTTVTIPSDISTIPAASFNGCTNLTAITIPKSVTTIGSGAFYNCPALSDVYYGGTQSDWNAVSIGTLNAPLLGATMHYGATDFAAIRYKVPAFNGTNTTLTFKSESMSLTVSAADGNFEKDNVQSGVYKVYAKQKNALTIYLGEYDTASGAVTNTGAITLPLGDVNGNDAIGIDDISLLLATANYGKINTEIDLTGDRYITATDIALTLKAENYGKQSAAIV